MPRGGKRPGAGKPKGYKHRKTIEKDTAREHFVQRVITEWDPLIDAQLDLAKGLTVMFARDWETDKKTGRRARTGRFVRVTRPEEMVDLLNNSVDGEDYYRLAAKDADGRMLIELNTRVMGKPPEHVEHSGEVRVPAVIIHDLR